MSSHLKAELAATCSTLGRLHKGEYLIEPECLESVKDLIRYLKRDNEAHEIRRYLGESKVLQNDLIHIIKSCPDDNPDLFDVTLRLLINLTTPTMLFYGEEIPAEKIGRNIYLSLIGYSQEYKIAFCDVDFWNKVCGKLTDLFETDWAERSADDGIQIERILMLLRNVLQVPADVESEKRPDNDITVHDKVLWALRQSQILELLLFVSSNKNEEQYYLNLLEIFSLILREQNPKLLARCDVQLSSSERSKEMEDLVKVRESEKKCRNKYVNMRNFKPTFVMKGVKSLSNMDVVCHKSLDKVNELDLNNLGKKQVRTRRNRVPVESERAERRSTFSVRLFLKEFCLEFLSCSFVHFMNVVKNKLDSGKSLANDQTYYFWALKFFLDFATASNSDVDLVKSFLSSESFHFVQTSMDNAFEHLLTDKKKTVDWVKRIHLILKAYRSLLEALLWMDSSKNPLTRSISRQIKSQIFYVVEYREMTLHVLLQYDSSKFSVSYLRDLIETTHLFVKLLEEYSKQTKLVVQKVTRKKANKKTKKVEEEIEITPEEAWEKIKNDVYDTLCSDSTFPEMPPFDAALDIPIDDQKGRAMKKIQIFLREGNIRDSIGLLRSARQVWPENDCFGSEGMSIEDETMALQEICLADLGEIEVEVPKPVEEEEVIEDEESGESELEERMQIVEQDFDIMDYKKRLVHKKVVEGCGILLKNYKSNSDHTNHCVIKLLHRIGWECCMPAMLFQASIFWTLYKIMRDKTRSYDEINTFTINLMRKFRKHASQNPVVFLELLFWKDHNVALEIQHGYAPYEKTPKQNKRSKKKKTEGEFDGDEVEGTRKRRGRKKKNVDLSENELDEENENGAEVSKKNRRKKKGKNKSSKFVDEDSENRTLKSIGNLSRFNEFRSDDSSDSDDNDRGSINESNEDDSENNDETEKRENSFLGNLEKERETEEIENNPNESRSSLSMSDIEEASGEKALVDGGDSEKEEALTRESENLSNVTTQKSVDDHEKRRSHSDLSEDETTTRNSKMNDSSDDEDDLSARPKRGRALIESSDDEKEDESQKSVPVKVEEKSNGFLNSFKDDSSQGKESDHSSSSSHASNVSRKKRAREHRKVDEVNFSEDSLDSESSKSKKLRYIGSDSSDIADAKSDDELPTSVKKQGRRRRLAVIDSDSDLDTNSLDDK